MALLAEQAAAHYRSILDMALAMATYTAGALLAGFMLALLPLRIDGRGYLYSAPLSVLTVFAIAWHQPWSHYECWIGAMFLLLSWLIFNRNWDGLFIGQTLLLLVGLAMVLFINYFGYFDSSVNPSTGERVYVSLAWPWQAPIGCVVAFLWGYLLARPRANASGR
jgi:hypothetical protein